MCFCILHSFYLCDQINLTKAVVEVEDEIGVVRPHRGHPGARRVEEPHRRHAVASMEKER